MTRFRLAFFAAVTLARPALAQDNPADVAARAAQATRTAEAARRRDRAQSDATGVAFRRPVRRALFARGYRNEYRPDLDYIKFERWLPASGPINAADFPALFSKSGAVVVRALGMSDEQVACALRENAAHFIAFHDWQGAYEAAIDARASNRLRALDGHHEIVVPTLAFIEEALRLAVAETADMNGPQKFAYIRRESFMGRLDFAHHTFNADFYLFDGRVYDSRDFGNLLWGAAVQRIGVGPTDIGNLTLAIIGSNVNSLVNDCNNNPMLEKCRSGRRRAWELDSPVDQDAIRRGFDWSRRGQDAASRRIELAGRLEAIKHRVDDDSRD